MIDHDEVTSFSEDTVRHAEDEFPEIVTFCRAYLELKAENEKLLEKVKWLEGGLEMYRDKFKAENEKILKAIKNAHICDGDFQDDSGELRKILAELENDKV